MAINFEKMTAEIDLMKNNKCYVIKDGRLIEHDLPDYGETVIVTHNSKVTMLETKTKRQV